MTPEGFPETPEEYAQFLEEFNQILEQFNTQMSQRQQPAQQKQSGGPQIGMDVMSMFGGGEAAATPTGGAATVGGGPSAGAEAGGAGMGSAGVLGAIIAAITYAQHQATKANKREFEGQKTGDVFSGNFATEPWFAALTNKLGLDVTAGEKFDAAVKNKDTSKALKRLPAAADYWADPIRSWLGKGGEFLGKSIADKKGGKIGSAVFNPIGALLGLFGK